MSIFSQATQSGWYPHFLKPVVREIIGNGNYKTVLDIGTGPGTLPQMLIKQNQSLQITGTYIDKEMISEAKRRSNHPNITFLKQQPYTPLPFENNTFDTITFCSVLFLLENDEKIVLINEAIRVLKPNGKILVLTPSGSKPIKSSFTEVWKYPFSINNYTFMFWKTVTTHRGRKWNQQKWLAHFANDNNLKYSSSQVFNNNALLEIITK